MRDRIPYREHELIVTLSIVLAFAAGVAVTVVGALLITATPAQAHCLTDTECADMYGGDGGPAPQR